MNDLISRQAAKNKKVYSEERHEYVVPVAEIDWLPSAQPDIARDIATIIENEQDMRVILNAPSAQPGIIQCKDCINWQREWEPARDPGTHFCYMVDGFRDGDWYCADAEKRG